MVVELGLAVESSAEIMARGPAAELCMIHGTGRRDAAAVA
jgi:hypothetical protein